ncbi:hypothetical protein ACP70R_025208 [Stipagrostis hirtigluma subsp. patula]
MQGFSFCCQGRVFAISTFSFFVLARAWEVLEERRAAKPEEHDVKFGVLFNGDWCGNIFEALVGSLRAIKKRKIVRAASAGVHES